MPRYFWHFFLVPGLLLLSGAMFSGFHVWSARRLIAYAQGTVTSTNITGKLGIDFNAGIEFRTPDGSTHTFTSTLTYVNALRPGGKVTVVYDIDDPDHARIEMHSSNPWEGPIILSVWGGVFALIGGI